MRHKTRNRRISTRDSTGAISRIRDTENALHSNWVNVSGIMLNAVGKTKPCYRFAPVFTLATNTGAQGPTRSRKGSNIKFSTKTTRFHVHSTPLQILRGNNRGKYREETNRSNFRTPTSRTYGAPTRHQKFPHHVRSLPPTRSTLRRHQPGHKTPTSPAVNPTIYPPTRQRRAARAQIT